MEWAALVYSVARPFAEYNKWDAETPLELVNSGVRHLLQESSSCDDGGNAVNISDLQTVYAGGIVLSAVLLSGFFRLGITTSLFIAAIRAAAQLVLLGYILTPVFTNEKIWMVCGVLAIMNTIGAREIYAATNRYYTRLFVDVWFAIFIGGFLPIGAALLLVIKVDPWYKPQYIIPMMGMILGNVLKGVQLALDSATQSFTDHRSKVELYLARGATKWEAARPVLVSAARCGITPTINFMSIMGLVSIPGMMTGQILGGTDPLLAAKYQIVIIFLIAASCTIGVLVTLYFLQTVVFDSNDRLTVDVLIRRSEKSADIVISLFKCLLNSLKCCLGCCTRSCRKQKSEQAFISFNDIEADPLLTEKKKNQK